MAPFGGRVLVSPSPQAGGLAPHTSCSSSPSWARTLDLPVAGAREEHHVQVPRQRGGAVTQRQPPSAFDRARVLQEADRPPRGQAEVPENLDCPSPWPTGGKWTDSVGGSGSPWRHTPAGSFLGSCPPPTQCPDRPMCPEGSEHSFLHPPGLLCVGLASVQGMAVSRTVSCAHSSQPSKEEGGYAQNSSDGHGGGEAPCVPGAAAGGLPLRLQV